MGVINALISLIMTCTAVVTGQQTIGPGVALSSLTANIGATNATTTGVIAGTFNKAFTCISLASTLYIFVPSAASGQNIKIFNRDGASIVNSPLTTASVKIAVHVREGIQVTIFLQPNSQALQYVLQQSSPGVYAWTAGSVAAAVPTVLSDKSAPDPDWSVYAYLGQQPAVAVAIAYLTKFNTETMAAANLKNIGTTNKGTYAMVFIDRNTLVTAGEYYEYYFFDKTNMNQIVTKNPVYTETTQRTHDFLLNNIRGSNHLYCHTFLTPNRYLRAVNNKWTGLGPMVRVFSDLSSPNIPLMVNVGTYQYLAIGSPSTATISLIYKANFSYVSGTFTLTGGNTVDGTLLGDLDCSGIGCLMSRVEAGGNNFQSYYLLADSCLLRDSFLVCSKCIDGYYLSDLFANNICVAYTSIPNGKGIYAPDKVLRPCSIGCTKCQDDYEVCTQCNFGLGYYLLKSSGACLQNYDLPKAFGPNLIDGIVYHCKDDFCTNCTSDYQSCNKCNSDLSYYLNATIPKCIHLDKISAGSGINKIDFRINFCRDTNCQTCSLDVSQCLKCNTASGYYLNTTSKVCIHTSAVPEGAGPNLDSGNMESCRHASCVLCKDNSQICIRCNTTDGMYLANGTCHSVYKVGLGLGVDVGTTELSNCTLANCAECRLDTSNCQKCDEAKYHYLIFGKCVNRDCVGDSCKVELVRARFSRNDKTAEVKFTMAIDNNNTAFRQQLNISITNLVTGDTTACNESACVVALVSDGFKIAVKHDEQILMGRITIEKTNDSINPIMSPDWVKVFDEYPIVIDNLVILSESSTSILVKISDGLASACGIVRYILTLFTLTLRPSLTIVLDRLLSKLTFLRLMNGPPMVYPSIVFDSFEAVPVLPYGTGNTFYSFASKGKYCKTAEALSFAGVYCSIFLNYGENLMLLIVQLIISIAFSAIVSVIFNTILKQVHSNTIRRTRSSPYKLCVAARDTFGLRCFLIRLDGLSLQVFTYAYINMTSPLRGPALIAGGIVSLIFLIYYALYTAALFFLARDTRNKVRRSRKSWELDPNYDHEMLKIVDIDDNRFKIAEFVFDQFSYRVKPWYMFKPVFDQVKVLLFCMFLMSFDQAGFTQLMACLVVEGGHFLMTIARRVKVSRYEYWYELVNCGLTMMFLIFKMATFATTMTPQSNQGYFGVLQVVCVYLLVVTTLAYVAVGIIMIGYRLVLTHIFKKEQILVRQTKYRQNYQTLREKHMAEGADPNSLRAEIIQGRYDKSVAEAERERKNKPQFVQSDDTAQEAMSKKFRLIQQLRAQDRLKVQPQPAERTNLQISNTLRYPFSKMTSLENSEEQNDISPPLPKTLGRKSMPTVRLSAFGGRTTLAKKYIQPSLDKIAEEPSERASSKHNSRLILK